MTTVSPNTNRSASLRHIYKPGIYKLEISLGRLEGQPDFNSNIDKIKDEIKTAAVEDALTMVRMGLDTRRGGTLASPAVKAPVMPEVNLKLPAPFPWNNGLNTSAVTNDLLNKAKEDNSNGK